jgi:predicted permease
LWQAVYAQLAVPDPQQIFTFESNVTHKGRSDSDASAETFSLPTYRFLAANWSLGAGLIARHGEMVNVNASTGPRHLLADFVSGNFFSVLETRPVLGRIFQSSSADRSTVVISYDFWQQAYGGQPVVWKSLLRVNGMPFRVVGVMPPGFSGLISGQSPKLYLPVEVFRDVNPGWTASDDWSVRWLNVFIRLPLNITPKAAEAALQPVYRAAVRQEPAASQTTDAEYLKELSREHLSVIPASQGAHAMLDQWQEPLRVLQWMTLALLLLAAANIAGLLVVRAFKQRREVLIRYALGATRAAVMRLQVSQTLILSLLGGVFGLLLAGWGARVLVHLARLDERGALPPQVNGLALAAHWLVALMTGLAVGLFPAWHTSPVDLAQELSATALTHSGVRSQSLVRRSMAAVQIALSLVLAVLAGLFGKSLHNLVSVPVGFNAEHLTVFSIDPKLTGSSMESAQQLWSDLETRLKKVAGVRSVTYGTGGPFPQGADAAVVIPGKTAESIPLHQSGLRSIIGPRFFSTLGIPLVAGREFDARDRANAPGVIILNQTMARKLYGDANPIGRVVTLFNGLDPNWQATVIGVAADHHQSWRRANASLIYTPAQQAKRLTDMTYYVRTKAGSLSESLLRDVVRREAPAITPYDVAPMENRMAEFASQERAMTLLLRVFASFALVIAGVGTYGVVAHNTASRTAEFAIRMSVGAGSRNIALLVFKEVSMILVGGTLLAVPLTVAGLSVARHQLQNISLSSPAVYMGAVALLGGCCILAAAVPVLKATRTNVLASLRHT